MNIRSMNVRQLLERRTRIAKEMRDILDSDDGGGSDDGSALPDDKEAAFNKLKAALAELEDLLSKRALIEEAERRSQGTPIAGSGDRQFDREMDRFSIVRAIAARAGLQVDAGRELELSQEIARRAGRPFQGMAVPLAALRRPLEQRVITTTTPSADPGGNLIQTTVDGSQYIDLLRAALVIRQLGARVLTDLTSNVDIPRLARAATAGWVAENTALPVSDEGFDKVSLRPKHAGAIVELSRNMLMQPSQDVEQLVRADLAAVLARVLDGAAISGTGTNNDPVGILNAIPASQSLTLGTGDGGALAWSGVLELIELTELSNVQDDSLAFLGNPKIKQAAMQTPRSVGNFMGFIMEKPDEMAGYSYKQTNLVPSNGTVGTGTGLSTLIFGNWSDLVMGLWSELDILVNPYESSAYAKGNVQVRAMMTCDIALRHPQSFAALSGINTTIGATS